MQHGFGVVVLFCGEKSLTFYVEVGRVFVYRANDCRVVERKKCNESEILFVLFV